MVRLEEEPETAEDDMDAAARGMRLLEDADAAEAAVAVRGLAARAVDQTMSCRSLRDAESCELRE